MSDRLTESDTLAMIRSVSPLDCLVGGAVFVAIVVGAFFWADLLAALGRMV